jgi:hypothetical protein
MKVARVGDQRPVLEVALEAEDGVELVGAPEALGGEGEIPQLAAALRAF